MVGMAPRSDPRADCIVRIRGRRNKSLQPVRQQPPRDGASYIAFFVLVLMLVFFLGIVPTVWRRVLATLHVNSRRKSRAG
jgi:hypothetical protein